MVGEIFLGTNDACDTSESVIDVFRISNKSSDSSDSSESSDPSDSSKSSDSSDSIKSSDSSESSESSETSQSSKASASVGRHSSYCIGMVYLGWYVVDPHVQAAQNMCGKGGRGCFILRLICSSHIFANGPHLVALKRFRATKTGKKKFTIFFLNPKYVRIL